MRHLIDTIRDVDSNRVKHAHGERFIQRRFDAGDSPATINKKIRSIKRVFQLATQRGLLENNPFACIRKPRSPKRKVNIYTEEL